MRLWEVLDKLQTFGIYFAASKNATRIWDLSDTERDLSYRSKDDSATLAR